jgi:hypothetical protein
LVGCGYNDGVNGNKAAKKIGMGKILPDDRKKGVDPELLPYVRSFEAAYGKPIGDITVNFGEIKGDFGEPGSKNTGGTCTMRVDGRREVNISRLSWELFKEQAPSFMEPTVWHELGHCVLERDHTSARMTIPNSEGEIEVAASVMYPSTDFYAFDEYRDYYIGELFRRSLMDDVDNQGDSGSTLKHNDGCVIFE